MWFSKATAVAAAAAALNIGTASAATSSFCPTSGVCFEWGVPDATAKAGSGDIFFQLKAPTSWQWIGLGIGTSMPDSNMFIMYQDGKGNVTLSTRPGANHVMPTFKARSDVELLAGSGVVGGNMVANVRCGNCTNLDFSGQSNWISAWKSGDALDSTNPAAIISQHDSMTLFQVNLGKASISSDSNPFSGSSASNSGSSSGNNSGSSSGDGDGDSDGNGNGGAVSGVSSSSTPSQTLPTAHGFIMSVVFVILYPLGSSLMPLIGKWYIHASWQTIAFLLMWAGFGIGVFIARQDGIFFQQAHTRLGVILVCLISLQPIFGIIHHVNYLKHQRRGIFGHLHQWYGRSLMIIGIVNGGLGLQLGDAPTRYIIAYSVVAGVTSIIYVASIVFGVLIRGRRDQPKDANSS
ncbi:hypothetical protein HDV63DRAFT_361144 [Trichoderma sp. SZMC 28014]